MRKLLGYRLKKNCEWLRSAIEVISDYNYEEDKDGKVFILEDSKVHNHILEAGVMHWFEEVYEEEKFTGWAKDDSNSPLWMGYYDNNRLKYGFDASGNWFVKEETFPEYDYEDNRKATTEEIQQALIKEASKRGFKDNSRITDIDNDNELIDFSSPNYSCRGNWFELGDAVVFRDGKWAEILPAETLNGKTAIIDGVEYELKIKS